VEVAGKRPAPLSQRRRKAEGAARRRFTRC